MNYAPCWLITVSFNDEAVIFFWKNLMRKRGPESPKRIENPLFSGMGRPYGRMCLIGAKRVSTNLIIVAFWSGLSEN